MSLVVKGLLEDTNGRLFVYASTFSCRQKRLEPISVAVEKMARLLNLNFEIKTLRKQFTPIYVYYKIGEEEPIPIYCNNNELSDMQEIFTALRNMMFVLSFHPKHSALKNIRKEIMQFS